MNKKKSNIAIEQEKQLLIQEVCKVQEEMSAALSSFSDVIEPELMDYYTYSYKANELKHTYLIKKLKQIYYNIHS